MNCHQCIKGQYYIEWGSSNAKSKGTIKLECKNGMGMGGIFPIVLCSGQFHRAESASYLYN